MAAAMTDQQVRDEAMTILLAGHETTANALTWTWYLLSQSPDVAGPPARGDRWPLLGGRLPTVADMPSLPFVERVVTEAMRLYPPAWLIGRRASSVSDRRLPGAGPHDLSHEPVGDAPRPDGFFSEPERFNPDRWTPEFKAALPTFAYFPFGGGPRQCIGESFAWMELVLVVATIAQRWKLAPCSRISRVVPQPLVTLRTKYGMRMTVEDV